METKKFSKTINIARKHNLDLSQPLDQDSSTSSPNIFKTTHLQLVPLENCIKPYECVGGKELKDLLQKKGKNCTSNKKRGWGVIPSCSFKSYSAVKSSEQEDQLMTKQEIFMQYLGKRFTVFDETTGNYQFRLQKAETNKSQQFSTLSRLKFLKKNRKVRMTDKEEKYLKKLEQLKKNTVQEQKQNLPANLWIKTLRNSINMGQIYENMEHKLEVIRNGFKLVAESKKKKEFRWIESHHQSALFVPLKAKKKDEAKVPKLDTINKL